MGNKNSIQIAIRTDKNHYYPGQQVNCSLYINSPQPQSCLKVVLQIQGYQQSEFVSSLNGTSLMKGKNILIQTYFVLKQYWAPNSYLQGQYQSPCSFTLPYFLPGSFNEQKKHQYKAKIQYLIKAIIVPHGKKPQNIEKIQELIIRQPQKSATQNKYGQIFLHPKCLWKNRGVAKVCCYFQKNNYLPNQQCIMICEVDNFKSKQDIQRVICQFTKVITLKSFNGVQNTFSQILNTIQFKGARKGQGYFGSNAQRALLPLKYKNSSINIHPSTIGNLVKCQYFIRVKTLFGGCFTKGSQFFSVKLQILQPQIFQNLQKPAQWNPQIQNNYKILLNYKDQNQMRNSIKYNQSY